MIEESNWRLAFLARYAKQDVTKLERMPVERLNILIDQTIKLLKKENALSTMSED